MIVVVDAGGTGTEWGLISGTSVSVQHSIGFNASVDLGGSYWEKVSAQFLDIQTGVKKLYFYGAGVGSDALQYQLKTKLREIFVNAQIYVASDLLGAGRALFGTESGMIGVLGTGSACGEFSEDQMSYRVPSLGYLLGDEGSGFELGKKLIKAKLRNQLPNDLNLLFEASFPDFNETRTLEAVYRSAKPNGYISGFCKFLSLNQAHPYNYSLVHQSFRAFFNTFHLRKAYEKNLKWRFSGSVAFHFQEILKNAGSEFDLYIDKIIQSPIEELCLYHQKHG